MKQLIDSPWFWWIISVVILLVWRRTQRPLHTTRPYPLVYLMTDGFRLSEQSSPLGSDEITLIHDGEYSLMSPGRGDFLHDGDRRFVVTGHTGSWANSKGPYYAIKARRLINRDV